MPKLKLLMWVGLVAVLAACSGQPAATPTVVPTTVPTTVPISACKASAGLPKAPNFPATLPTDQSKGSDKAPAVLYEYSDFQWPYCALFATDVERQLDKYIKAGQLRFVYRYMAFLGNESQWAAEAAECAAEQGKFWEYHDTIFANQKGENQGAFSKDNLKKFAANLEFDTAKFNQCLDSGKYADKIKQSNDAAGQFGVSSTPTVFINGVYLPAQAFGSLNSILPYFVWLGSNPKQYTRPDKVIDPAKKYTATIKMAKGNVVIELLADRAPNTVNSFVFLARNKFFDGLTFHRVLEGFMAQGGDPSGTGLGGPGYTCNDEIDSTLVFDKAGVLAMANSGANTNGSQFFITVAPRPELNGKYTIFGRVVSGQDVVSKITLRDSQTNPNAPPGDMIQAIVIEEK